MNKHEMLALLEAPKNGEEFIDMILSAVSDRMNIPIYKIHEETRKREIVQARQVCMKLAKIMTNCSLATIGERIGMKDHATVLHACKTVDNLCETDREFRGKFNSIKEVLDKRIPNIYNNPVICSKCGSNQVEIRVWLDINTSKVLGGITGHDPLNNWCRNCRDHVGLITLDSLRQGLKEEKERKEEIEQLQTRKREYDEQLKEIYNSF